MLVHYIQRKIWKVGTKKLRHSCLYFSIWVKHREVLIGDLTILSESESEVSQLCPTLSDPMDCSLPGSTVHGILQARTLEWVAISFSRGSSPPRNQTQDSRIGGRCFNLWATKQRTWCAKPPSSVVTNVSASLVGGVHSGGGYECEGKGH